MARTDDSNEQRPRSWWGRLWRATIISVDIVVAAALLLSAYSGMVSPIQHGGIWGVFPLALPFILYTVLILLAVQIFFLWRGAIILMLAIAVALYPVLDVFPLNFTTPKVPEGAETFTLMSYNAHQFVPSHEKAVTDTTYNPTLQYILETDADIVCLQEATYLGTPNPKYLTGEQIQSYHHQYPEVLIDGRDLAILSKYPVEAIHTDALTNPYYKGASLGIYRVTLPSGRRITIFNVHMASMRMRQEDRDVYVELTRLHPESLETVKSQLIHKLSESAVNRAVQTQQLLRYLRLYGGPDVIVTGDFNDVPTCYTLRELADVGFRSAYSDAGLGPIITFADERMYFRIDHTLYRGDIRPVKSRTGSNHSSDHYPLLTTFYLTK